MAGKAAHSQASQIAKDPRIEKNDFLRQSINKICESSENIKALRDFDLNDSSPFLSDGAKSVIAGDLFYAAHEDFIRPLNINERVNNMGVFRYKLDFEEIGAKSERHKLTLGYKRLLERLEKKSMEFFDPGKRVPLDNFIRQVISYQKKACLIDFDGISKTRANSNLDTIRHVTPLEYFNIRERDLQRLGMNPEDAAFEVLKQFAVTCGNCSTENGAFLYETQDKTVRLLVFCPGLLFSNLDLAAIDRKTNTAIPSKATVEDVSIEGDKIPLRYLSLLMAAAHELGHSFDNSSISPKIHSSYLACLENSGLKTQLRTVEIERELIADFSAAKTFLYVTERANLSPEELLELVFRNYGFLLYRGQSHIHPPKEYRLNLILKSKRLRKLLGCNPEIKGYRDCLE